MISLVIVLVTFVAIVSVVAITVNLVPEANQQSTMIGSNRSPTSNRNPFELVEREIDTLNRSLSSVEQTNRSLQTSLQRAQDELQRTQPDSVILKKTSISLSPSSRTTVLKSDTVQTAPTWNIRISDPAGQNESAGAVCSGSTGVYLIGMAKGQPLTIKNQNDEVLGTIPVNSSGVSTVYCIKLSTSGNFEWVCMIRSNADIFCTSAVCDEKDNVYLPIAISSKNTVSSHTLEFENKDTTISKTITTNSNFTRTVAKYTKEGTFEMVCPLFVSSTTRYYTSKQEHLAVATYCNENVYFSTANDFDLATSVTESHDGKELNTISSFTGSILSSFNCGTGTVNWMLSIPTSVIYAVKASTTGLYVSGTFKNATRATITFPSTDTTTRVIEVNPSNFFVAKYSSSGIIQWVSTMSGYGSEVIRSLDVDSTGVVIAGKQTNVSGLRISNTESKHESLIVKGEKVANASRGFLLRFDTDGLFKWGRFLNDSRSSVSVAMYSAVSSPYGIAVLGDVGGQYVVKDEFSRHVFERSSLTQENATILIVFDLNGRFLWSSSVERLYTDASKICWLNDMVYLYSSHQGSASTEYFNTYNYVLDRLGNIEQQFLSLSTNSIDNIALRFKHDIRIASLPDSTDAPGSTKLLIACQENDISMIVNVDHLIHHSTTATGLVFTSENGSALLTWNGTTWVTTSLSGVSVV